MIPNNAKELNYSKVKTYRECPYLFKLKYILGKREGLVPATSLGVSIHRTLEAYHSNSNDPSEILRYYNRYWLGAGYSSAAEQMEYYLKGKRMLEVYGQKEYSRNTTVYSTEKEFIFEYEGWTFRGKIDRIDKLPDGTWEVIDYKTDAEIDENFDIKNSLQLAIYSIGARRTWNMQNGKASIYFIAADKKISADFSIFEEKQILDTFISAGQSIEMGEFKPDTRHCEFCLMNNRCRYSTVKKEN